MGGERAEGQGKKGEGKEKREKGRGRMPLSGFHPKKKISLDENMGTSDPGAIATILYTRR
jgi:hypothetical protein